MELIPPDAQYEHNPTTLVPYPQFVGSLLIAGIQSAPDKESGGTTQSWKSALIWELTSRVVEQRLSSAAKYASLSAKSTHESAHNGRTATPDKLHSVFEFWTIALQRTDVVKRA